MAQSEQPSSRIDSKSSLGTSRMKLDRISTEIGMAKAMDGRIRASRVSYMWARVIIQ